MGKKYQIINSNTNVNDTNECTVFYLLYIVLFFVIIFIIYKIIFCFNLKKDNFENFYNFAGLLLLLFFLNYLFLKTYHIL